MKLRPIGDHIVVKALPAETKSASGIIIPETSDKKRPERGEVIAVGNGHVLENGTRSPMDVKPGDNVVFKKYAPDEVKIDGIEYLIISMGDVMAIVE